MSAFPAASGFEMERIAFRNAGAPEATTGIAAPAIAPVAPPDKALSAASFADLVGSFCFNRSSTAGPLLAPAP